MLDSMNWWINKNMKTQLLTCSPSLLKMWPRHHGGQWSFVMPYNSFDTVSHIVRAFLAAIDSDNRSFILAPVALFPSSGASLLLQKLEEIFVRASQGASDDYLSVLIRVLGCRGEKEALERLKTVRLALAQYFARSLVSGLGRG